MHDRPTLADVLDGADLGRPSSASARPVRDRDTDHVINVPASFLSANRFTRGGDLVVDELRAIPQWVVTDREIVLAYRFPRLDVVAQERGEVPESVGVDDLEDDRVLAD